MRVLYVAPRYHTNQIPIMEGWRQNGHEVLFVSQMTNEREDHTVLKPVVLGYSSVYSLFFKIENRIRRRTLADELFAASSKRGFPPYCRLKRIVKEFRPDVAILRERSIYTVVAYYICNKLRIPSILYNQSPYWHARNQKRDKLKKMFRYFFPRVRMTPVLGFEEDGKVRDEEAYYVPFVMEPHCNMTEKEHFAEGKVQIVCVAGYHDRKKLPMLIDAANRIKEKYAIHLCIVGEVITQDQKEYYDLIKKYVIERQLQETITLYQNCERKQVFEQYKQSDLFVLPSTRERASISQLEAMSCSLPIICSDTNGAACQIENGINGYTFQDGSLDDLAEKIELSIKDRRKLLAMGEASYRFVCEKYSFEVYQKGILQILANIRGKGNEVFCDNN